jgi:hypothetical protein
MMAGTFKWLAAVLAGLLFGVASGYAAISLGGAVFSERYGAWSHSRAAGAEVADMYTRAIIAREGLLALSAREALYFTLDRDEDGRPLEEACIYELSGRNLRARWWSITLYAEDDYLARNSDHAHSIDASRLNVGANGRWRARISSVRGDTVTWLSSREARRGFSLTLRVYNPHRDFEPSADALPVLTKLSCGGR